ncbi:MAG TPA: tetratricopeptide repeat protein [Candidatus Binatia bacterium]|nr:tetratricopeptide repeat protein [Candidatus Binatia bacterium]
MIGAPLVFFGLLELALRLSGFGHPTRFLLSWSDPGRKILVQNNQFGWRFFGARMSRLPHPISLAERKAPGTLRVFVFAESAAFGDPQPRFGLPRMIEALLDLRHPGVKFEVVDAAMTAINSHAVVPIARDCARADGDVWVVYMGNNEVVGPFGAGTVFGQQVPPLPLIRASLALKATRTGQLLDALREKLQKAQPGKEEWGGMMMFLNQRVADYDRRMDNVYHDFQRNLEDIIRAGHVSGAGVVVSTVAVNLRDCAPFASLHRAELSPAQLKEWEGLFQPGLEAQKQGNWPEAQEEFRAAARIDDRFAELRFRLGECALALGESGGTRSEFAAARDLDALRFRCDSRLNGLIRQAATNREADGILLADAESALAAASPNGLTGAEMFYEHVHLTFEGNYVLARTIAEQVEKLLKLPASSRPWSDIAGCARRLGWTDRARQLAYSEILGRLTDPPFTLQIDHTAQQQRLAGLARKIAPADAPGALREAQVACEAALASWPEDALLYQQLAEVKQAEADHAGTVAAATRSLDLLPANQECRLLLGLALAQEQKFQEAAAAFRRVFELDPQDVWGRQNLAICWQKLGRRDDAIREFRRALALKPRFGLAWLGLGQVYEDMGRRAEAADCYRLALANRIHRAEELNTLARFCQSRGWFEAAATNYAEAITLSPSAPGLRLEAGQALAALGRHEEAAQRYAEALQLSPDQGQTHFLRGLELGRLGRPNEAEQEFRAAARLMPDVFEARLNLGIALYQEQKLDEALTEFEEVLHRSPTNALALKYVAAIRDRSSATNMK